MNGCRMCLLLSPCTAERRLLASDMLCLSCLMTNRRGFSLSQKRFVLCFRKLCVCVCVCVCVVGWKHPAQIFF